MRITTTLSVCAVALSAVAGASLASAQEASLKAVSFLPERAVFAKHFYRWVDEVNNRCDGKVEISVVGPEAIPSLEQWRALKDGVVDMHFGPPNYYKGVLFEADVSILANVSTTEQRKNGAWDLFNRIHNEKMNAWYLTHITDGVPFFVYTSKPKKAGDKPFEGFRLRSVPIYDPFFSSLGAQTVRMAPPDVYTALERGTVDGYGWPLWGITDFGWHEHTKFRHGPGFFSAVVNILMNLDSWKGLDDGQQQCITDMAMWLEEQFPSWREDENKVQSAAQEDAGIQYVDMGSDFKQTAHDMYWKLLMEENPEVIGTFRELLVE